MMATKKEIRSSLIAWANGDLTQSPPTAYGSDACDVLHDAIQFELGLFTCDDAQQREKAIASIEAFVASEFVDEFVDA